MRKIGIIGAGNMGTAIISRIYRKYSVIVCEKDSGRAALLKKKYKAASVDLTTLARTSDIVVLAVKPQDMDAVLRELKGLLQPKQLVISIAAGLTTLYFEARLGAKIKVVRAMPNMPAQIGEGVTALCKGRFAVDKDLKTAAAVFAGNGTTVIVPQRLMDSVTAVSGSGPAYVFMFAEYFLKAAQKLGLDKSTARALVTETLKGSVHLLLKSQEDAGILRARVTSKGGTTQAALDVFGSYNIEKAFVEALAAAKRRAGQLAR